MREWFAAHEAADERKFEAVQEELRQSRLRMEEMSKSTLAVVMEQNRVVTEIHTMFSEAFPEGDVESHRRAHEKWIKKAEADEQFWLKLKQHVVNWAVVAVIGWIGIALWAAFLRGPA